MTDKIIALLEELARLHSKAQASNHPAQFALARATLELEAARDLAQKQADQNSEELRALCKTMGIKNMSF